MKTYLKYLFICFAILLVYIIFAVNVLADSIYLERFDDYNLGSLTNQSGSWTETGTTTENIVERPVPLIGNYAFRFSSESTVSDDYIEWNPVDNLIDQIFQLDIYWSTGDVACISMIDASSTIHDYVCIESAGDVYINGQDSSRNISNNTWTTLFINTSTSTESTRIRLGGGSWSTYKNYAGGTHETHTVRFSTDNISNYAYVDDLTTVGYYSTPDDIEIIDPNFDYTTYYTGSEISFVSKQICWTGENCNLWFSYSPDLIGDDMYLVPDTSGQQNPVYAIATTTIVDIIGFQNAFSLPVEPSPVSYNYCMYRVGNGGNTDGLYCSTEIEWTASSTYFDALFDDYEIYNIDSACSDLTAPTSTNIFFDTFSIDFWDYTLSCSFRKISYWLFTPHDDIYRQLGENITELSNSFPISIYNQVFNEYNSSIQGTTTPEFELWIENRGGSTTSIGNLLDVDNFQNATSTGYNLWITFYGGIETVMWALMCGYFIFRLFSMSRKEPMQEY